MPAPGSSLKSVSLLTACSFLQMGLQFAFQLVLARLFGTTAEMDAFAAALAVPAVLSTILIGTLQYAFTPVFVQRREQDGEAAAWETAGTLGSGMMLGIAVLCLLGSLLARPVVEMLQPGFPPEQTARTAGVLRILIWQTWTISTVSYLQAVYYCEKRYWLATLPLVLGTLLTLIWTLLVHETYGIRGVAGGVVAGGLLTVAIQLPGYVRKARPRWRPDAGTVRVLWLMVPLFLGALYYKLDPFVDRALASHMEIGSIARLDYASRLIAALLALSTNGMAIVVFPLLARHAAVRDLAALKLDLGYAVRFLVFLLTPCVIGLILFAQPMIHALYERGKFMPADTVAVGQALALFAGVLIGGAAGEILGRVFFALGDTRTPPILLAIGFTSGVAAKFWLGPRWGIGGLAAATSGYYLVNALLLHVVLSRRLGSYVPSGLPLEFGRAVIGSLLAVLGAWLVFRFDFEFHSIAAALTGMGVYALAMRLMGDEFTARLLKRNRGPQESRMEPEIRIPDQP